MKGARQLFGLLWRVERNAVSRDDILLSSYIDMFLCYQGDGELISIVMNEISQGLFFGSVYGQKI